MATSRKPFSRPPFNLPITTALVEIVQVEFGSGEIARAMAAVFECEEPWGEGGSPWRQFYSKAAAMPGKKLILWNTDRFSIYFPYSSSLLLTQSYVEVLHRNTYFFEPWILVGCSRWTTGYLGCNSGKALA